CGLIDAALEETARRDLRQELVRGALFIERFVEQLLGVPMVELACERTGRAVRGDLVVLNPLRSRDDRRVLRNRVTFLAEHVLTFGNESLHCLACARRGTHAQQTRHFLEPPYVSSRLLEVIADRLLQLGCVRGRGNLRERRDEL